MNPRAIPLNPIPYTPYPIPYSLNREPGRHMTEEMDFRTELNNLMSEDQAITAAGLTFLSDIPTAERATLALMWPGMDTARRRKIAATLVQLAEDNIDYDFSAVYT